MTITTGSNLPAVSEDDLETARQQYISKVHPGRPSIFSLGIAAELCARVESGDESLTEICKDSLMPCISTVNDWRRRLPEFAAAVTRARRNSAAALTDNGYADLKKLKTSDNLNMAEIRRTETVAKYAFDLAKCYDREQFGAAVQVQQNITIESMDQRLQRLTGTIVDVSPVADYLIE